MSNYQTQTGTLLEGFDTIGDWTVTTGTGSIDTTIYKTGQTSLKLTSGLGTNVYATKTINLNLASGGLIYFWVYIEDISTVNGLTIYLSNDSGFTNYFSKALGSTGTQMHEGWNKIAISRSGWSQTGSPVWTSNMVRLRVRCDAVAATTPVVYFDSMYYGFWSRPKVIISFDDGWASQHDSGYTYMRTKGLRGSCYIIQARIGTANYMTTANLRTLHDAGWDMMNHTVNHNNMVAYTQDQAYPEIQGCKEYLMATGFTRRNEHLHLAYPNGGYNNAVLAAMAQAGMYTGRTIYNATQPNEIDSQYLLKRQSHAYTASSSTYLGYIDRTVADGGSVQINYHKIVADGTGAFDTEVEVTQFQTLIDYVAKLHYGGVLDCVTFTEWYEGLEKERKDNTIYV